MLVALYNTTVAKGRELPVKAEHLHPLTVHLPLGLLTLIPFCLIALLFTKSKNHESLKFCIHGLFIVGLSSLGMSTFLGDMAFDEVRKNLCSISAVYAHEEAAYYALSVYLFSYILFLLFEAKKLKIALFAAFCISIGASYFLIQTGHSGAMLVYEQGAGVLNYKCHKN